MQYALDTAGKIAKDPKKYTEIWLGVGSNYIVESGGVVRFKPSSKYKHSPFVDNTDDERAKSFVIPSGVSLFGHFGGIETDKRRQDRTAYITVLDGDLKSTPRLPDDDVYNVVVFGDGVNKLDRPSYLNGILISNGNANHKTKRNLQYGGGLVMVENSVAQGIFFINNEAINGGAVYMQGKCYLNGSLILANKAKTGGAIYTATSSDITKGPIISYNTVANSEATESGAGAYLNENLRFIGNVLWNNKVNGVSEDKNIAFANADIRKYEFAYNFANDPQLKAFDTTCQVLSNINKDTLNNGPLFLDPLGDNGVAAPYQTGSFKLSLSSPMYNDKEITNPEYSSQVLLLDSYDIYGYPRKTGAAIDFGAAEYEEYVSPNPTNNRLYVSNVYSGKADGSSWSNAIGNLSAALEYFSRQTPTAGERFEIWISSGTFFPKMSITGNTNIRHYSFILDGKTDVYGGFRGLSGDEDIIDGNTRPRADRDKDGNVDAWEYSNMTILSGLVWPRDKISSYHTLYREKGEEESIIDGLQIVSGKADGKELQDSLGGGLYTSKKMTIRNCSFLGNAASKNGEGAAIYAVNSLIDASYFALNTVSDESVDTNISTGVVTINGGRIQNSVIEKNKTAAIKMVGTITPVVSINNTLVGNTAGILNYAYAEARVINTISWNNKRSIGDVVYYNPVQSFDGVFTLENSAIDTDTIHFRGSNNLWLNTDNKAEDGPLFKGLEIAGIRNNYRLDCFSTLINAGDSADWLAWDVDFAGKKRIIEKVDIGAYETPLLSNLGGEIDSTGETICAYSLPTKTITSVIDAQGGSVLLAYRWYCNDTLIPEATSATYLPTQRLLKDAVYTRFSPNDCGEDMPASGSWLVRVNSLPSGHISADADIEKGDSAVLQICFSGTPPFIYRITNDSVDREYASLDTLSLTVKPEDTTLYNLTYMLDAGGCEAPLDSLTGEALISVTHYINIASMSSEGGEVSLSDSGKVLFGTPIHIEIKPKDGYYLRKFDPALMSLYADYEKESLYADFEATQDSIVVCEFAPLQAWNNEVEEIRFNVNKTAALVYSSGELAHIADQVSKTGETYKNVQFKLMNNLDLGGVQDKEGIWNETLSIKWLPIGGNSKKAKRSFYGLFDGNNKQIRNLYVNTTQENAGLFGSLGEGARVQNLAIVTAFVKAEAFVGALSGRIEPNVLVSQVFSIADVKALNSHAGGLTGLSEGNIENSYYTGSVQAPMFVGGIAAENKGTLENTYSTAHLSGNSNVFGVAFSAEGTIKRSYFDIQMAGFIPLQKLGLQTVYFDTVFSDNPLWKSSTDHYPALLCFDNSDGSQLSVECTRLQKDENVDSVNSDIAICRTHEFKFEILNDGLSVASLNDKGISISRPNNATGFFTLSVSKGNVSRYLNFIVEGTRKSYMDIYDSICFGSTYSFAGVDRNETGEYYDSLTNIYGEDSIVTLHLVVIGQEEIEMNTNLSICSHSDEVYFDFKVVSGYPSSYSLSFDLLSKAQGFIDTTQEIDENNRVVIKMPSTELTPNRYTALVKFKNNANCPSSNFNISIKQGFKAEKLINQKNNFLLYLKNSSYNSGYSFKDYQWLFDGEVLQNEKKSYYYSPSSLRTDGLYSLRVKMMNDVELEVCPFKAVLSGEEVKVYPSSVGRGQNYNLKFINFEKIPDNSQLKLFDVRGYLLEERKIDGADTKLNAPGTAGFYLLRVEVPNKEPYVFKIIVN